MPMTRRSLLRSGAMLAAGAGVLGPSRLLSVASSAEPGLAALARASGRYLGTGASIENLLSDTAYRSLVLAQCDVLTPENELKWTTLRPSPTQPFNFALADVALTFAEQNGLRVRGSCFTWANDIPWWFDKYVTPANALSVLEEHITTVMTRYKGRIFSYDVVNEATDGKGYYPTRWAKLLGPRYIDNAFTIAHRVDPGAQLVLNEYNLEYHNHFSKDHQRIVIKVLDDILSRGIPVHALGVEAHLEWEAIKDQFDAKQHRGFLRTIESMGLRVVITEMDVLDLNLPTDHAYRDKCIGDTYKRYLGAVLEEPVVEGILSWGLSDKYSWMNTGAEPRFNRADGDKQRPLPYDDKMNAKPAARAFAQALAGARRAAPPRHR